MLNKSPLIPNTNDMNEPKYIRDEIGLKIRCQKCHQYYYTFETSYHFKTCQTDKQHTCPTDKQHTCPTDKQHKVVANSPEKINSKSSKQEPKQELQEKPAIVPKQQQISIEQPKQILFQQIHHNKQQIAELNRFQQAKTHLSRVAEAKKSRVQNKIPLEAQQQGFEAVDCPFCRKKLQLDELDHADNCAESMKCEYCDQKIAISLKNLHFGVCIKRLQKLYQSQARELEQRYKVNQKIKVQKKEQRPKPNLDILNKQQITSNRIVGSSDKLGLLSKGTEKKYDRYQKPNPKVQQKRQIKKSPYNLLQYREIPFSIKKQEKNQEPCKIEVGPKINQLDLDMKSRIRALKKKGIPQSMLDILPRVNYDRSQFENQIMCPVGYQDFNEGEKLIKLACSHIFHQECLFPYLKDNISCPVCKKEISL